jgi:uncharacterized membrane protein YraQ (UPF0718 family)
VVPAVAGLKKQGANNGACLSFLISTPETGADSIALTYSLLDPIITVLRPLTAFVTAAGAGIVENFTGGSYQKAKKIEPDRTCIVDGCCDGVDCDPSEHAGHHTIVERLTAGFRFAFVGLMSDLAGWFVLGILLAGIISALVPESFVSENLGSGIVAYLSMLAVSLPMYVCASMSTPVAAALILKGMSPGAALVLLMAGPATNMATIAMVGGMLGRRTLAIYLGSIVVFTMMAAYVTDFIYSWFGISAKAAAGAAGAELVPQRLEWMAAAVLGALIIRVIWQKVRAGWTKETSPSAEVSAQAGCCDEHQPGGT